MKLNDPALLAEVTEAFYAYERALMTDDIAAMDALFHDAHTTVRFGAGEVLFGSAAIREFRKGRGGSPQRRLGRVAITVYGDACATADAEFFRDNSPRRGRQSQTWVKFGAGDIGGDIGGGFGGWKVVSAHVSLEGHSH